ncbi:TIGR04222 domain-containing membrane protein [Streptomyces sp. NBC_01296]|uniref:TIGR04222 domain-containing membrane protein n=1 Tax=Streptomyces sp. NBC_01296 TaxID=2903816 RepID=UPI002E0F8EC6|nr:TIGR04222 domain-containing membrane protein [Streptomyces sp. NBC_01296]
MWVYIFLGSAVPLLGATFARIPLQRGLDPEGRADTGALGLYEAAYLAGGRQRVAEVALTALHLAGMLPVGADGRVGAGVREEPAPADPVQADALRRAGGSPAPRVDRLGKLVAASPATAAVGKGLAARGLAVDPGRRERAARTQVVQQVLVALAVPATVAACAVESATGEGDGLGPFLAFAALGAVTGLTGLFAGPVPDHATATGRRRSREVSADETRPPPHIPWPVPDAPVPAEVRSALVEVVRHGISRAPAALAGPTPAPPSSPAPPHEAPG